MDILTHLSIEEARAAFQLDLIRQCRQEILRLNEQLTLNKANAEALIEELRGELAKLQMEASNGTLTS